MFEPFSAFSRALGSAEQYRTKAKNYRAAAAAEPNQNRREAFELLADTFEKLAAGYERAGS